MMGLYLKILSMRCTNYVHNVMLLPKVHNKNCLLCCSTMTIILITLPIILMDFTYHYQHYVGFDVHGITNTYMYYQSNDYFILNELPFLVVLSPKYKK